MTRTERIYYLIYGLYSASWSFLTAVYTLYLLDRGLDLFEVNVVFAVYLITAFLFEVPTGAVADVLGRKASFLFSCALRCLAFALYWFAHDFTDFLVAEFFDAVGTTLATGALDAWAVDRLKEEGHEGATERLFTRALLICRPMMMAAGIVGGYVADSDIGTPWIFGAASFAITGLIGALLMRDTRPTPGRPNGVFAAWIDTTRAGITTVRRDRALALLCVMTAATSFAVMPAWHYWPVRLASLSGTGTWLMGWVGACIHLCSMAATALMPRLVRSYRREHILCVAWLVRGSMLLMAAIATSFTPALFGILVMDAVFGLSEPTLQAWMNENVASEQRATVLSLRSMSFTLGGGVGLILLGLLARSSSIPWAWGASACVLVLAAPVFLVLKRTRSTRAAILEPANAGS